MSLLPPFPFNISAGDVGQLTGALSWLVGQINAIPALQNVDTSSTHVILGVGASAPNSFDVAVGTNATVNSGHTQSTALGANAATTKTNQVMLGTATEKVALPGTLEAASVNTGTIGAVTINAPAGRVNIAASATSVVVTNSVVAANSHVFAVISQADATAILKNVVPAAGSFTINLSAAATANTSVDFFVVGFL